MVRKFLVATSMLYVCMLCSEGRAAIVLSVDMDLLTPGIQANIDASPGSTVTAGLMVQLTETSSIAVYNFSVEYDRNELTFLSRSETPEVLTNLSELDMTNPNSTSTGQLFRFDGGTFAASGGPTAPFGPVKVGQISFTATAPIGLATDIDIRPGRFEPSFDSFFDNPGNDVTGQVTFFGGSVSFSVIPEPSTLGLVLIGCSALSIGVRRRSC